jgi:hypothetical protein
MNEPTIYLAWESPAREKCVRGRIWWIIAGLLIAGLLAYSILSANFAFAVIVVMFGLLVFIGKKPVDGPINIVIAREGILVNSILYTYPNIKEFFIVTDPARLFIVPNQMLGGRVDVFIPEDIDNNELRMVLRKLVKENTEQVAEPLGDTIARKLKLF